MKITLIDGSGYFVRAFHGLPPLSRSDGQPVGAIHGFCSMLHGIVNSADPERTHIAVVMDAGHSGRGKLYPAYKANRGPKHPDLTAQFPYLDKACSAFNVATIREDGYEADDAIATYARLSVAGGMDVEIFSSDKDMYQLIRPGVSVFDPLKRQTVTDDVCIKRFGVTPDKAVHVQALLGDTSDNIPGVHGIGAKTAGALVREFGDVEGVLMASRTGQAMPCTAARRMALIELAHMARLSLQLVTLQDDIPFSRSLDELQCTPVDQRALSEFMDSMEFVTLGNALANASQPSELEAIP